MVWNSCFVVIFFASLLQTLVIQVEPKHHTQVEPKHNTTQVEPKHNTTQVEPKHNTTQTEPKQNSTQVEPKQNSTQVAPKQDEGYGDDKHSQCTVPENIDSSPNYVRINPGQGDGKSHDDLFDSIFQKVNSNSIVHLPEGATITLTKQHIYDGKDAITNVTFVLDGTINLSYNSDGAKGGLEYWMLQFGAFPGFKIISQNNAGVINGGGPAYWKECTESCPHRPSVLELLSINEKDTNGHMVSCIRGISIIDAPGKQLKITHTNNISLLDLRLRMTSKEVKNTDGMVASYVNNLVIDNVDVLTTDDCFTTFGQTSNIHISNLRCTGGGVALGLYEAGDNINNVVVDNVVMDSGTYGIFVKNKGPATGTISNVAYSNVQIKNTSYPIWLTQYFNNGPNSNLPPFSSKDRSKGCGKISGMTLTDVIVTPKPGTPGYGMAVLDANWGAGRCFSDIHVDSTTSQSLRGSKNICYGESSPENNIGSCVALQA